MELVKARDEEKHLKTKLHAIENDLLNADKVSAKLIELKDRSRRNKLRIDGIKEERNEIWEAFDRKYHYE